MSRSTRDKDKGSSSSHRDRSPLRSVISASGSAQNEEDPNSSSGFSKEELMNFMSNAMSAQMPKLILEASKVVSAQIQAENQENSRSFTAFSQEMKQLKLRQEEVAAQAKAGTLKGEGIFSLKLSIF